MNVFRFSLAISKILLTLAALSFNCHSFAHTKIDPEIYHSHKCYSLFRFYETKYRIPKNILFAISLKETGKPHSIYKQNIVWPWSANIEGQSYIFKNKSEAVRFIKLAKKVGKKSIDIGCMQINSMHHPYAFSTVEQAFDPKANINYAAYFLATKYKELGDWNLAISNYHSATPSLGSKYYKDVSVILKNIMNHHEIFKPKYYMADLRKYDTFSDTYQSVNPNYYKKIK
jgi:hypothetical protein